MCLIVKEDCKPEIAKKDIVCYKLVNDHVKCWEPLVYPFKVGYLYPYNRVLTAESCSDGEIHSIQHLEIKDSVNLYGQRRKVVEYGFHAMCIKACARMHPCIIPKGSEYCLGDDYEIVAVNMIVFRSMLGYYWYKIKKLWQE